MEQHLALNAVLIPSVIALLVCGASRLLPLVRRLTPVLVPLALGAVAVRAAVVQHGASILATWPPAERWITAIGCVAATAIGGGVLGLFSVRDDDRGRLLPSILSGLMAAGIVLALLAVPGESTRWIVARTALAAGLVSMVLSTGKVRGPGIFLSLAFPMASLAGLLLLSGNATFAVTAGAMAFTCGTLGLLAIALRITLGAGGIATMVVASASLAAEGRSYDDGSFPSWLWIVVMASPVTGMLADLAPVRLLPSSLRFVLRVAPPLLVSGGALFLAAWHAGAFSTGEPGDAYGP